MQDSFKANINIVMYKYLTLALLLFLLNGLTINHCALCNTHMIAVESPLLELSLDFAPLDRFPVNSSSATILWNGNEHGTLKPTDRSAHHFKVQLRVVEGPNTLSIVGVNGSTGIIIDNITLSRQGNSDNIVENGNFQAPGNLAQSLKSTFIGWTGTPKSINAKAENKNCASSIAALVLPGLRYSLGQTFNFDRESRYQTDKYTLTFDYAAQKGAPLDSTRGSVTWNAQVFQINPKDYEVHSLKVMLKPDQNKINFLTFKGEGKADGFGLTVSNIKLITLGSSVNMVLNGDFSMPVAHGSQKVSYLPGWDIDAPTVTIAEASFFNKWWPHTTKQVLTLDDGKNTAVAQQFKIASNFKYVPRELPFFQFSFDYAAYDDEFLRNSKGELLWNGELIAEFSPESRQVSTFKQNLPLKPGQNEFTFKAKQGSTLAISNLKVVRLGLKDNIATNGDFQAATHHRTILGWAGQSTLMDSADFNKNWKDSKVARLSSEHGESLSQQFHLDKDFRFRTNRYHLELEMAPTEEAELNTPLGELTWNGKVYPLVATSRKVQKFKVEVTAVRGPNMISISGQGKDGEGLSIDNIKLIPLGSSTLSIKNGDFQDPEIKGNNIESKHYYEIPQWSGYNVELGFGDTYNENWSEANDQVLSLATKHKTMLCQVLVLTELATMGIEEPNIFTLSFKYAAEDGKPLAKTGGEVYWNKKLVGEFVPTSYNIIFYSQQIKVESGENHLLIKAAGGLEAYGLTIDDIKLVRQGSEDNLIENGEFEGPSIPGWASIHNAPLLNHMWVSAKVGRLDPNNNISLTKVLTFDEFYRFKTNKMHLLIDFVAKEGVSLSSVGGTCRWNKIVQNLTPRDYKIQTVRIPVIADKGYNTLSFQGEGLSLDNVRLIPLGSVSNVLINGDFEIPVIDDHIQKMVPSGWNGYKDLEFGRSYLLSREWGFQNGQVVGLTQRNKFLSQTITLDSSYAIVQPEFPFFTLSLDYAAADEGEETLGEVYWNGHLVTALKDKEDLNHLKVRLDAIRGANTLQIKPKNQGVVVGNVKLTRFALDESIIQNGDFKATIIDGKVPYWAGVTVIDQSEQYLDDWKGQKVAVLDDQDESISQVIHFDGNLRYITQDFVVSFQYGVRQGVTFDAAKAKAYWNNDIFHFTPTDHKLRIFKKVLRGRKGNNNLIFQSDGQKRAFGTFAQGFNIDNVCVRPFGSLKNVLKNSDFDEPKVEGFEYGMFTKKVPGWITDEIYIGVGHYFGPDWGWNQILELAGEKENAKIMQQIKVNDHWEVQL